mmetsp:Transcript_24494/g.37263  ORF Transcript_24494/g.37263 Transcript_24494/m.37263 type:complete len:274 (+) Transcript_24494:254-1075(+)
MNNANAPLLIGIALTVLFVGIGTYMSIRWSLSGSSLSRIDAASQFEPLSCRIETVRHTYDTKRRTESCGHDCTNVYYVCVDRVQYVFSIVNNNNNDHNNTTATEEQYYYSSRLFIAERNKEQSLFDMGFTTDLNKDQCTVNEDENKVAYEGDADTPCFGLCPEGTIVDCWKPTTTAKTNNNNNNNNQKEDWARCGNEDCIKLVDPQYELDTAQDTADFQALFGYFMIGLGVAVAVFAFFCCYYRPNCCCCSKNNKNDYEDGEKENRGADDDDI